MINQIRLIEHQNNKILLHTPIFWVITNSCMERISRFAITRKLRVYSKIVFYFDVWLKFDLISARYIYSVHYLFYILSSYLMDHRNKFNPTTISLSADRVCGNAVLRPHFLKLCPYTGNMLTKYNPFFSHNL